MAHEKEKAQYEDDFKSVYIRTCPQTHSYQNNATVYAAFCGTGKSHFCRNNPTYKELECWEYRNDSFPDNYVTDVLNLLGKYNKVFISTDPIILNELDKQGVQIILIYPEHELRNEYLDRYIARDSPYDFIGTIMKNWNKWLKELREINFCKQHIVLKSNQYLQNVLQNPHPTITIGGMELPRPEWEAPKKGTEYWVHLITGGLEVDHWSGCQFEFDILAQGRVHLKESRAQEWADWWQNNVIKAVNK